MRPLCFVLMPFGVKKDASEKEMNFNLVYTSFIKPAIVLAGLEPIRADEEQSGGFIHKPMYERLMFCDFAVADLSFANANVFYELGIRHALKPYTTVSIFEIATRLPFDTAPLRTFNYEYKEGAVLDVQEKIKALAELIKANLNTSKALKDSPIAQLITGYKFPDLNYLQEDADAFKDWVMANHKVKESLESYAQEWQTLQEKAEDENDEAALKKLQQSQQEILNKINEVKNDSEVSLGYNYELVYALLNTYKCVNAFKEITEMLEPLMDNNFKDNVYLKQQLALAYNKIKNRSASEKILKSIIDQYGNDAETNGLLGATYKGMMNDNLDKLQEKSYRTKAINAYLEGFDADPRDYYPGINALNLIYYGDAGNNLFNQYLPMVQFAVDRQLKKKPEDYWLQATRLELAVLLDREDEALDATADALTTNPQTWMRNSTVGNLKKLYLKKVAGTAIEKLKWLDEIKNQLS